MSDARAQWMGWQQAHQQALEALQAAAQEYHRLVLDQAFACEDEARGRRRRRAALEELSARLDELGAAAHMADDPPKSMNNWPPRWWTRSTGPSASGSPSGFPRPCCSSRARASAEAADHHPDIEIHYKRVMLLHHPPEGGLTPKDFEGARAADDVAAQVPHLSEFGDG
jgi:hypothetical protein